MHELVRRTRYHLVLGALSFLACSGPAASPPVAPPPAATAPPAVTETRRSVKEIAAQVPQTLFSLHVVHLAELYAAGVEEPDGVYGPVLEGLGQAVEVASDADVALLRDLVASAPELTARVLDTLGGRFGLRRAPTPAAVRAVDAILLDGASSAVHWAVVNEHPGQGREPRRFLRSLLERAATAKRCPSIDEQLGRAVDEVFGTRQGVPCMEAAAASPSELDSTSTSELLQEIAAAGSRGDAAAVAMRSRVQVADAAGKGQLARLLTPEQFGGLLEVAGRRETASDGRRSLALQLLTSAHNEPRWVEWLADHGDRVPAAFLDMVVMLLEQAATRTKDPKVQAAAERLRKSKPGAGPAVPEREDEIEAALVRCDQRVREHDGKTWLAGALREAEAARCDPVASAAARLYTPRLRRALLTALEGGSDAWVYEVFRALHLAERSRDLPPDVARALLRRERLVGRLLIFANEGPLWDVLPESDRTEDRILATVARQHAEPLLGGFPDRIEAGATEQAKGATRAQWFRASSSDPGSVGEVRVLVGILPHTGPLRPIHVPRMR